MVPSRESRAPAPAYPGAAPDRDGGGRLRFHRLDVRSRLPHPGRGFTQGLVAENGTVWESTGLYGESTLRRYRLGAQQPEASVPLLDVQFGEGICRAGGSLWQLTWEERVALRWDPDSLQLLEEVPYNRAGWGICAARGQVVTSDGTSELIWRDPGSLQPLRQLLVRCGRDRVRGLNDLTWSGGRIWANVLGRDCLAGIDPDSGDVTDIVDARAARERHWGDPQAVMNGVAALPADGEFLLTGKRWRYLRHVRLVPARPGDPARLLRPDW